MAVKRYVYNSKRGVLLYVVILNYEDGVWTHGPYGSQWGDSYEKRVARVQMARHKKGQTSNS